MHRYKQPTIWQSCWYLSILWSASLMWTSPIEAGTRRALLIGINHYAPADASLNSGGAPNRSAQGVEATTSSSGRTRWPDLGGAVNDVQAMQAILGRYGFRPEHVRILLNEQATRTNILHAIREQLVTPSERGDEVFFHYSGHGSQVANSRSPEPDKMDETIVPADAAAGARDIRDKELRRLFNDILDKGARVTVVFDNCHSGSAARGLLDLGQARYLPSDTRDIAAQVFNEEPDQRPDPESRGALILSAAQDYQRAYETESEEGSRKQKHGAFTLALWKTLRMANPHEPAEQVFRRARALLRTNGKAQDPVLAGSTERRQAPLFSTSAQLTTSDITVAVQEVSTKGHVKLEGGLAAGLRQGCELERVTEKGKDNAARIRIEQVDGWNHSTAHVISGDVKAVRAGDLFKLVKWAVLETPDLRIWLPPGMADADLTQATKELAGLRNTPAVTWIDDPTTTMPTHVVSWDGTTWKLTFPDGGEEKFGATITTSQVLTALKKHAAATTMLFVHLPPGTPLMNAVKSKVSTENANVEIVRVPQDAQYHLVGRINDGEVGYAWVRASLNDSAKVEPSPLPARSDWVSGNTSSTVAMKTNGSLSEYLKRLARIRAWMTLESPPDIGLFPYRLALKNPQTNTIVTSGALRNGERWKLVLVATDPTAVKDKPLEDRCVYIFILDSNGKSTLLYPQTGAGCEENRVRPSQRVEIPLAWGTIDIRIQPPFGLDTYVLLTSSEAIPDQWILNTKGVMTTRGGLSHPLARLLYDVDSGTKRGSPTVPVSWSIERLQLQSVP